VDGEGRRSFPADTHLLLLEGPKLACTRSNQFLPFVELSNATERCSASAQPGSGKHLSAARTVARLP
jgi:hypothetical protein